MQGLTNKNIDTCFAILFLVKATKTGNPIKVVITGPQTPEKPEDQPEPDDAPKDE